MAMYIHAVIASTPYASPYIYYIEQVKSPGYCAISNPTPPPPPQQVKLVNVVGNYSINYCAGFSVFPIDNA